jgi:hypothetical protein
VLRCQVQLELTLMMCMGDRSTFTLTSTFNGRHDGSLPLFFWRTRCLPGVCVCLQELKLSPPQSFHPIPLFPFKTPFFSLKSYLKVSKGICSCCKGPTHPLGPSFNLFKNHYDFVSFSSLPCSNSLIEFQLEIN